MATTKVTSEVLDLTDAYAFTGAVTGAGGGDKRNFIIDGDMTQWPAGTSATTSAEGLYSSALIKAGQGHDGATTCERSTDVPTIAESVHQSKYSLLVKCTGTDTSLTAGQYSSFRYHITGTDFSPLHKQQVTISFWTKTSAANSGHTYYLTLMNDAYNRSYTTAFVPTSSWTKITKTITLDTSGTWEFTEALTGLRIMFVLAIVSGYTDITADTWTAGFELAPTGMSNFLDDTGNEFYLSQFQCVLGSSSPTFLGESVATVANQVHYYVKGVYTAEHMINVNTTYAQMGVVHNPPMRIAPSYTHKDTTGTAYEGAGAGAEVQSSGTGILHGSVTNTKFGSIISVGGWTTIAANDNMMLNNGTTLFGLFDARH